MVDFLVVGLGLAGVAMCHTLEKHGASFKVIDNSSQTSSQIAAGLYNPVILKRFTLAWKAKDQIQEALPFYASLETKLEASLDYQMPVLRRFASVEEQNRWFEVAEKAQMQSVMTSGVMENKYEHIRAPYGFGEVLGTGRIDTEAVLLKYMEYLQKKGRLLKTTFDYEALAINKDHFNYQGLRAKKLVFATGFGLKQNPFFNYLPLTGTKGELLVINAPDLKLKEIIKAGVFIIPISNDQYKVGATYNWKDKTKEPTAEAREEIEQKLSIFMKAAYQVTDHLAGIRPTVTDRRPLVGSHPQIENMYVLNGLGSRGVLTAPYAAKHLYDHITHGKPLPKEMDVVRFKAKYSGMTL